MVSIERKREISREWARRARLDPEFVNRKREWQRTHPESNRLAGKRYREKIAGEVFAHYGGKCVCCGFADLKVRLYGKRFLQMDHINGNGSKERQRIPAARFYIWLKLQNYPSGYRILCAGCNNSMLPGAERCLLHGN